MPDFTEILQNIVINSNSGNVNPHRSHARSMARSNDIMTSCQHHVTAEQYVSILQMALIDFL